MPVVAGTSIAATTQENGAGFTHVLTAPASLLGFEVPAGATLYTARDGSLQECIQPVATTLGSIKLARRARIAADRGRWLMWGFLSRKVVQGGLTLAGGSPVRVRPDGTVMVAFSSEGTVLRGEKLIEGTRLDWTGSAWHPEADGEYVPDTREEDEEDETDVIVDDADDEDPE